MLGYGGVDVVGGVCCGCDGIRAGVCGACKSDISCGGRDVAVDVAVDVDVAVVVGVVGVVSRVVIDAVA